MSLWRAWAVLHWSFQGDDWAYVADATRLPFGRFVLMPYNGHLLIGQFILVWVVAKTAALNYGVAVAPILVAAFASGVVMWKLLTELFGERPWNLVLLAVFLLCPLTIAATVWWAASLTIVPLQLFIAWILLGVLRYIRAPSTRRLLGVAGVYALALLFWQKSLLIFPLVVLFALLFLGEGRGRARVRFVVQRRWRLWASLAILSSGYAALYVGLVGWQLAHHASAPQVGQIFANSIGVASVPAYLGGPWATAPPFGPDVLHTLSLLPRAVTWGLLASMVAASLLRRRQAWRGWVFVSAYLLACIVLVAFTRLGSVGPTVGLASRYLADTVPVFALGLALAFEVPIDRQGDPAWYRPLVRGLPTAAKTRGRAILAKVARVSRVRTDRPLALACVAAYAASSLVTGYVIVGLAQDHSSKTWFANVRSGLADHPDASIIDAPVPLGLSRPSIFPFRERLSTVLSPIASSVRWNAPASEMWIFDVTGRLRGADVKAVTTTPPGPSPSCGYLALRRPITATLSTSLFPWTWGIRLNYFTGATTRGIVMIDGDRQTVEFVRGVHTVMLLHHGPVSRITLQAPDGSVCVGRITAGGIEITSAPSSRPGA